MVRRSVSVGVPAVYGRSLSDPTLAGRRGEARHSFYFFSTSVRRLSPASRRRSRNILNLPRWNLKGGGGHIWRSRKPNVEVFFYSRHLCHRLRGMHVSLCVCCVRAFTFHVLLLKEALKPVTAFRFGCGPNLPLLLPLLPPPSLLLLLSTGDHRTSPLYLQGLTPVTPPPSPAKAAASGLRASNWRVVMLILQFGRVN